MSQAKKLEEHGVVVLVLTLDEAQALTYLSGNVSNAGKKIGDKPFREHTDAIYYSLIEKAKMPWEDYDDYMEGSTLLRE